MNYKTHEFAELLGVSSYTIRYYDKEGLIPFVTRDENGYRIFTDSDINIFKTVQCLKTTGMVLKEIKQYIHLVEIGPETVAERLAMLQKHRQVVLEQQALISESLKGVQAKIDKYQQANAQEIVRAEMSYVQNEKG